MEKDTPTVCAAIFSLAHFFLSKGKVLIVQNWPL